MRPPRANRHQTEAVRIKALVRQLGLHLTRKLGQNFLLDPRVLEFIVDTAQLSEGDRVLEIGCGLGHLTARLAATGARVLACEIDSGLASAAQEQLRSLPNVRCLHCDALDGSSHLSSPVLEGLDELLSDGGTLKLVSNLPYCISTPTITAVLEGPYPFERMVLTLQKEVADRLAAKPGTKAYSYLSARIQLQCESETLRTISRHSFWPKPEIESAVVRIMPKPVELCPDEDGLRGFKRLAKAVFKSRRKTLPNAVATVLPAHMTRDGVHAALVDMGFSPQVRGETLTPMELVDLARALGLQSSAAET